MSPHSSSTVEALAAEALTACPRGSAALGLAEARTMLEIVTGWSLVDVEAVPRLLRVFRFDDFKAALSFANRVGELAEQAGHHPALLVEWGRVTVSWWTHDIGGLHRNDFIMAARTDGLY